MFSFCSIHKRAYRDRDGMRWPRRAMLVAGREFREQPRGRYGTTLTAFSRRSRWWAHASHRGSGEDARGRRSRVVLTPGVCASSRAVMRTARPGARISHP